MLRTLVAMIALITLISHANAEPVKAGAELYDFVIKAQSNSEQLRSSLLSMITGLPESEADYANVIYDAAIIADYKVSELSVATTLYTLMVDTRDMATVRAVINLLAVQTIKTIDSRLNVINRNMVRLRAPAVILEAQRVRDLLVETRDGLQKRTPLK